MYTNSIRGNKRSRKVYKRLRLFKILCVYVGQILKCTNLHGLIYVGNTHLTPLERIYFLTWFITLITLAANFATNVYTRWDTTPVLIATESQTTPIYTTPFPAITICNMNQALRSKTEHFPKHSLGYAMTQKICFQDIDFSQFDDLKPASTDDTFTNFIWRVNGQTCENMIVYCRYGDNEDPCTDFFREVLMDEGICCAFNILHPSYLYKGKYTFVRDFTSSIGTVPVDWDIETGYAKNLPLYYYPRTALGAGVSKGFTFVLNANISEYICSSTFSTGLKVIPHNPIDTPHVKETGLSVQVGFQHRFLLNIESFKALPSTRSISPKRRQCLFNNELDLTYYRYYTRRNCEMECDSEYYLRHCQCIPYYMPLIVPDAKVCHVKDFNCEKAAEKVLNDQELVRCKQNCLPGCFNLEYFPSVLRTPLLNTTFGFKDRFFNNLSSDYIQQNLAMVEVYFREDSFRSEVRSPYTSFTDYLSQTGGIMSLMVGFGVMSLPEFCYFFLIRPIFDFLLRRVPCTVRRVTAMTAWRFRKISSGEKNLLIKQRTFYPYTKVPFALSRRPLKSFNVYKNEKIRGIDCLMNPTLNSDREPEGLFPYTE